MAFQTNPPPAPSGAFPRVDLDPTSPEFAVRTVQWFKAIYQRSQSDERDLAEALAELRTYGVERFYPPENPYGDLDALLKAEIGKGLSELEAQIATTGRLRTQTAADETTGVLLGRGNSSNRKISDLKQATRGASNGISDKSQRKLDHLKRDHPALFAEVKAGRLSAHAAAVQAGIAKPTATVRTDDPDKAAVFLARHFTAREIRAICDLALGLIEDASP